VVVEEVVVTVKVEVSADVLVMSTEEEEKLHVAGLVALVGALTEQVRSTVPVNELAGVTVMTEVLPDVAAGAMVMLPPLEREKLVLLGACQKSPHPARNGRNPRKSPAHLARFIAAPLGLARGPHSTVPIAGGGFSW
jgi:hypothetical protein